MTRAPSAYRTVTVSACAPGQASSRLVTTIASALSMWRSARPVTSITTSFVAVVTRVASLLMIGGIDSTLPFASASSGALVFPSSSQA